MARPAILPSTATVVLLHPGLSVAFMWAASRDPKDSAVPLEHHTIALIPVLLILALHRCNSIPVSGIALVL